MFPLFDENEPGQGIAWVTLALIAINVAVFLFLQAASGPAVLAIGLWAVLQLVSGFGSLVSTAEGGGVAYLAHVGGFVSGVVFGFLARGIFGDPATRRRWAGG